MGPWVHGKNFQEIAYVIRRIRLTNGRNVSKKNFWVCIVRPGKQFYKLLQPTINYFYILTFITAVNLLNVLMTWAKYCGFSQIS